MFDDVYLKIFMCVSSSICENFERNTPSSIHPREIHQHPRECPTWRLIWKTWKAHFYISWTFVGTIVSIITPVSDVSYRRKLWSLVLAKSRNLQIWRQWYNHCFCNGCSQHWTMLWRSSLWEIGKHWWLKFNQDLNDEPEQSSYTKN